MGTQEAHDFVRWDVLDNLADRLERFAEEVRSLAADLAPGRLTMIDAPHNAKMIRGYFDALDEFGWYSDEQMKAAEQKAAEQMKAAS